MKVFCEGIKRMYDSLEIGNQRTIEPIYQAMRWVSSDEMSIMETKIELDFNIWDIKQSFR